MIYCLDTNVTIAIMRNQPGVTKRLGALQPNQIKISEIVRADSPFEIIPFSDELSEHYAAIRQNLDSIGKPIGLMVESWA